MVPKADTVADIGCDHGKVAVALIKNGQANRVICGDISGKSLDKARKTAKGMGGISLREGNGLDVLESGEADIAVMAGMGGELIRDILEKNIDKAPETLVLSCNTASGVLREWLSEHGYRIEDEELVFETRHFYPVILAVKGQTQQLDDMALEFGPVLLEKKPKTLKYFVTRRIDKTKDIRKKIEKSQTPNKTALLNQIDDRLKKYAELEKCL